VEWLVEARVKLVLLVQMVHEVLQDPLVTLEILGLLAPVDAEV
jgi:hypothetical protein